MKRDHIDTIEGNNPPYSIGSVDYDAGTDSFMLSSTDAVGLLRER